MRFSTMPLLLVAVFTSTALSTPLPAMDDIEKRWAAGDSEQQIHAGLSHRDMTPAWPVARSAEGDFARATDYRSLAVSEKKRDVSLATQMKEFVNSFMASTTEAAGHVPVVRPRKAMRYYFTS